jgi:hypothetical protein
MMKRVWTYFSLAFVAFACMATVSVSTSLAMEHTVLCKVNETPCEYANVYHEGEAIPAEATASSGEFIIANPLAAPGLTCSNLKIDVTPGIPVGKTLPIEITDWDMPPEGAEACKFHYISGETGWGYCVSEPKGLPFEAELDKGVLKVSNVSFHVSCNKVGAVYEDCTFTAESLPLNISESSESLEITERVNAFIESGTSCYGSSYKYTVALGNFQLFESQAIYESVGLENVTSLCQKNETPCAKADRYPANTGFTASAEGNVTIANSISDVVCTESTLAGETSAEGGVSVPVEISTWSLAGCTNKEGKSCTSTTTEALPESASLKWTSGSDGSLAIGKGLQWKIACNGISCRMTFEPTATFKGGSPGQIAIPETKLTKVSGLLCPTTKTFKAATYSVSTPKPVYVSGA